MPRHYKIIDLFLEGTYSHSQIAEMVDVTPVTVKNVLSMPSAQDIIARRRENIEETKDTMNSIQETSAAESARRILDEASQLAASQLVENLLSGDEKMRNKASNDILDRIGVARVTKNDNTNKSMVLVLDAAMADRINRTLEIDLDEI